MKIKIPLKSIINHPDVETLGPSDEAYYFKIVDSLKRELPELIKDWILNFGSVYITLPAKGAPFLILLGGGENITDEDDIILFNYPSNPSRPENLTIIAREFNGEDDIYYAIGEDDRVYYVTNDYAWHYFKNKEDYSNVKWRPVFDSIIDFWDDRIGAYLKIKK